MGTKNTKQLLNIFIFLLICFINQSFSQTGPELDEALIPSTTYDLTCDNLTNTLDDIILEIEEYGFYSDCAANQNSPLTVTKDCNPCVLNCNETLIITFSVTDDCNMSADFIFTFTADDGDGVPAAQDNCPDSYNPGQEDIDGDGIGNICDPENKPSESLEIQNNIYLNTSSSGTILKAQDGGCWFITVDNNGQIRSHSVDCPN